MVLHFYRKRRYRRAAGYTEVFQAPLDAPGVSILRPCRGLDNNLYENLESSLTQNYPNFEVLFSVAAPEDAAIPIIETLMRKHPQVPAQLIVGRWSYAVCTCLLFGMTTHPGVVL